MQVVQSYSTESFIANTLYKLDSINVNIGRRVRQRLRSFTNAVLGIILAIMVLPILFSLLLVLGAFSFLFVPAALATLNNRLRYRIQDLKSGVYSERSVMTSIPDLEMLIAKFNDIERGYRMSKVGKAYFGVLFGSRFNITQSRLEELRQISMDISYPHLNEEPSMEQLKRLLVEFEGVPVED